jgi:dienelactone hydrolase
MGSVSFPAPGGELGGHLSEPIGPGPWPGVIVIMDLFGLSDDIRDQTDRLAARCREAHRSHQPAGATSTPFQNAT